MSELPKGSHGEDRPLTQLLVSMSGASGPDHDTGPPGADKLSVTAGHEPDRFSIRGILYVPLAVVLTLVTTYVIVTVVFGLVNGGQTSAAVTDDQRAVEENKANINARFGKISSTDPKPVTKDLPETAVAQPRLEYLRTQEGGDKTDPPYYRSKRALEEGNSPEYRPEDLRPENFVDPTFKTRVLAEYGYVGEHKDLARVPINAAITMVLDQKKLPVRKDAVPLPTISDNMPKISNSGRAGLVPAGQAGAKNVEHRDDGHTHDHDHGQPNDSKKPEPKKADDHKPEHKKDGK